MASIDLAKRAYDHGWRLDPIVRSLLDTDFYKLLMLQLIWRRFRDVPVTFSVINRTMSVRLAEEVDETEEFPVETVKKLGKLGMMGKARGMANEFRASFDEMARQSELDELRTNTPPAPSCRVHC